MDKLTVFTGTSIDLSLYEEIRKHVIEVRENSDSIASRIRVLFDNGYELSVIYGPISYGYREGLFEVALFYDHNWCTEFLVDKEIGDQVIGHCTKEDVINYMLRIIKLDTLDVEYSKRKAY
jgi:hypothetical protein